MTADRLRCLFINLFAGVVSTAMVFGILLLFRIPPLWGLWFSIWLTVGPIMGVVMFLDVERANSLETITEPPSVTDKVDWKKEGF